MSSCALTVLLAAYNGDRFISEQLNSILRQELEDGFELSVIVGVDPSKDNTDSVVCDFCARDRRVIMIRHDSPSGNAQSNFSRLMQEAANSSAQYYCFSDQDDVWDQDKLFLCLKEMKQIEASHDRGVPVLVFSDSRVVAADLSLIQSSFWESDRLDPSAASSFKRVAFQNVGQGGSFLFNRALLELSAPVPTEARMHDHWVMLVASVFGKVSSVNKPTLSYRQHDGNVLGASGHRISQSIRRLFLRRKTIFDAILASERQASAFLARYGGRLRDDERDFFYQMAHLDRRSFFYRRWFLLRHNIRMSSFDRTLGLYLFI